MIYQSNTTGVTNGEGTAYPSGAPEFALVFSGICVVHVVKLHVFMIFASYCDVHLFCRGFTLYVCYLYVLRILVSIEEDMQLDNMNNISDGVRVS